MDATVFWSRVTFRPGNCWLWNGWLDEKGYGRVRHLGHKMPAHRYAYEETIGAIPDGLVLDHLCRTPDCVRPDHLEPVTSAENSRRGHHKTPNPSRGHFAVSQRQKTMCRNGHPYDLVNTYFPPDGSRVCRICRDSHLRRWMNEHPGYVPPARRH